MEFLDPKSPPQIEASGDCPSSTVPEVVKNHFYRQQIGQTPDTGTPSTKKNKHEAWH